jgi:phosphate uptake regulator
LPKEWIDANNLSKSTPVELETGQNSISITLPKGTEPSKEIIISYPLSKEENIVANITGAYLLGYDIINIKSKLTIPVGDREKIRGSLRRLVGMEIFEEDASNIRVQFLLDESTLSPEKILRRMSTIAFGMFNDILAGLLSDDKSNLQTLANRDDEIDRQYFLLVRLIRSTMVDTRLASLFNLENIDILDYRIAANLLETAGDTIVELANSLANTSLSKADLKKIYTITKDVETIHKKSIDAFIDNNRSLAIEGINMHRKYQLKSSDLRSEQKTHTSIDFLDLIHLFERVERCWADIADLVKPVYK